MTFVLETMAKRTSVIAGVLVLLGLLTAAYWPVVRGQAGTIWDDRVHVMDNPSLRDAAGLERIWTWGPESILDPTVTAATPQYYPLTFTTFWVEYQLWGANTRGYHLTNVALHACSALLLWALLRRLGLGSGVAYLAAVVFAVHPVQVESVAWITERKNTLSLLFFLAAAYTYVRWARLDRAQDDKADRGSRGLYLLVWVLFLAAMLSKTVTVMLPAALLVVTWWKRGRIVGRDVRALGPMLAFSLAMGLLTRYVEHAYIGARGPDYALTFADRILIAGRSVAFYAEKLVAPLRLTFIYPRWAIDAGDALQWMFPAAVVAVLALLLLLRKRVGRGPAVAAMLFVVLLFPALGFVNYYPMRYSFVADHFQYAASIGIIVLVIAAGAWLMRRRNAEETRISRLSGAFAAVPLIAVLVYLSATQCRIYQNTETLWRDTIAKNDGCWMAYENLAEVLWNTHGPEDLPECERLYRKTLALRPTQLSAYNALGIVYARLGQSEAAETVLRDGLAKSATLGPAYRDNPETARDTAMLQTTLASQLSQSGDAKEAQSLLEQSLTLYPGYASAWDLLGTVRLAAGDADGAIAAYQQAIKLKPESPDFYNNLGSLYFRAGKYVLAEQQFRLSVSHDPKFAMAWHNLGRVLQSEKGRDQEALACFNKAIANDPSLWIAKLQKGYLCVSLHLDREALACFGAALYVNPLSAEALAAMAELQSTSADARVRDVPRAVENIEKAVLITDEMDITYLELEAETYAIAKRYEEAVVAIQKAIVQADAQHVPMDRIRGMESRMQLLIQKRGPAKDETN